MKTRVVALSLLVITFATSLSFAQPPNNQRRLGILGGLGGAAIGAAIGEDDGDAVPGALIGGTLGLLGGAAVGNSIDRDEIRNQRYQAAVAQRQAQAVTMSDVVSMTHAGLTDAVIISHIQAHGVARSLTAADLIVLKQQGVRDPVLSAMQSIPGPGPAVVVPQPRPVVVEEHYYSPSPVWWHHRHYHHRHHHHRHCRPRSSIHFSFGN